MSRKKLTKAEAERRLREKGRGWPTVFGALPADVDAALAADAAVGMDRSFTLWPACKHLPAPVIREALRRLAERQTHLSIFVRESVDADAADADVERQWKEAIGALLDLDTTYAWGSAKRKAKVAGIAANPRFIAACQAASVGAETVPMDMLAVLVRDGSEASIDALMPHFVRATEQRDRGLDLLERMKTHASDTPAVQAMLAEVDRLLGERKSSSPALDVARSLGFGELREFWFWIYLSSRPAPARPWYHAHLRLDSREARWFSVSVSTNLPGKDYVATHFDDAAIERDDLKLGRCPPEELGAWLARAATTLDVTWDALGSSLSTNLGGKKREELARWLLGASAT